MIDHGTKPSSRRDTAIYGLYGYIRDMVFKQFNVEYTLFFYKNIFYKNIEAEICEILRIFAAERP